MIIGADGYGGIVAVVSGFGGVGGWGLGVGVIDIL